MLRILGILAAYLVSTVVAFAEVELSFRSGADVLTATAGDIDSAEPVLKGKRFLVFVKFQDSFSTAFEELTANHVGENLSVHLCGRELMRPVVRQRIAGGLGAITAQDTDQAITIAAILKSEADCSALEGK